MALSTLMLVVSVVFVTVSWLVGRSGTKPGDDAAVRAGMTASSIPDPAGGR